MGEVTKLSRKSNFFCLFASCKRVKPLCCKALRPIELRSSNFLGYPEATRRKASGDAGFGRIDFDETLRVSSKRLLSIRGYLIENELRRL